MGLEIKREFTVGHLASRRSAALPIAAAIGGMAAPALLYRLVIPEGPWSIGWGVPMATDTAFAVALIAMMGRRVPIELRIFLTAAAIVDDIGSIIVVALFYSGDLHFGYLAAAAAVTGGAGAAEPIAPFIAHPSMFCWAWRFGLVSMPVACTQPWPGFYWQLSSRRDRRRTSKLWRCRRKRSWRPRRAMRESNTVGGPSEPALARVGCYP